MPNVSEFEIRPRRNALEQVLSRLSIQTVQVRDQGTTGWPEITGAEFAGMLAGMPEQDKDLAKTATSLAWAYLGYEQELQRMIDRIDAWGRIRALIRHPGVTISGAFHRRLVTVLAEQHVRQIYRSRREMRRAMRIGEGRWPTILPVAGDIAGRLNRADILLQDHLVPQLAHESCHRNRLELGADGNPITPIRRATEKDK